jgi:hypothetical protein
MKLLKDPLVLVLIAVVLFIAAEGLLIAYRVRRARRELHERLRRGSPGLSASSNQSHATRTTSSASSAGQRRTRFSPNRNDRRK